MSTKNSLWTLSTTEIAQGYAFDEITNTFNCAICSASFEQGVIYPCNGQYYDAAKMIAHHIKEKHNGTFDYLIALDKQYTGVSPNQKEVLSLMFQGYSDDEIAKRLKVSISTIRNYRFRFKEKERQAKIYSALMQLLKDKRNNETELIAPHNSATTIDDRYVITEQARQKTLQNNFTEDGRLRVLPRKEKKKIIVLTEIAKNFKSNQAYTEKEVDRILKRIFDDHVTLRRYLIEYGFLDRNNDGSKYWVK